MKIQRKHVLLGLISPVLVLADQISKSAVTERFYLGESLPLIQGFFNLTYVRNTGAAFGLMAKADPAFRIPFFLIVPTIALIVIGYLFKKLPGDNVRTSVALASIIGGAIGNLIDRIQLGYVVDFLDFHWNYRVHFPAFNVADIAICVGVGLLMLDLVTQKEA